jgi:hypothetical protein
MESVMNPSPRLIAASGLFVVAASFIPNRSSAQSRYQEARNADVAVGGARSVRIDAAAGSLRVEGRSGLSEVRVRGTARTNRRERLRDIRLIAERRGSEIYVKADIPSTDGDEWRSGDGPQMALDLVIEVPDNLALDVDDGSGEAAFMNTGRLQLEDGSGEIEIRGARGSVEIDDGSGEITIDGVDGDVRISDGSGEINITNVSGSVTIDDDGSGSIDVRRVTGNFVVVSDGSGGITHADIRGRIEVPEKRRRRS